MLVVAKRSRSHRVVGSAGSRTSGEQATSTHALNLHQLPTPITPSSLSLPARAHVILYLRLHACLCFPLNFNYGPPRIRTVSGTSRSFSTRISLRRRKFRYQGRIKDAERESSNTPGYAGFYGGYDSVRNPDHGRGNRDVLNSWIL